MHLDIGQILSQIVAFLIMLAVLKRFAWKPLLDTLEARRQRIEDEFAQIEEQKADLQRQQSVYSEKIATIESQARQKIQEGVAEGRGVAMKIEVAAREQAKQILNKAQQEAAEELAASKIKLKDELVSLTMAATTKLLQEGLSAEHQQTLLSDFAQRIELE